jgi:hypothetical protein
MAAIIVPGCPTPESHTRSEVTSEGPMLPANDVSQNQREPVSRPAHITDPRIFHGLSVEGRTGIQAGNKV